MSNPPLPPLTFNRLFLEAFTSEAPPCLALGMLEVEGQASSVIALALEQALPDVFSEYGFEFGTTILGTSEYEVIQFCFDFPGYEHYNILINPNNPVVQQVLQRMLETNDYFFLALGKANSVTVFRSEADHNTLMFLERESDRIQNSTTTDEQYLRVVTSFVKNPLPPGKLLRLVCHEDLDYLDLSTDRFEMNPI